jgi:site-specific DNA-cytosine methylase
VLALGTVPSWSASQHADFCRKDVYGAHDTSCLEVPRELDLLRALRLRYFSPREVANLLGFPASFEFPPAITRKQQYKLLGNSVSVPVLIRLLEHAVGIERVTRYHPS